MSLYWCHQQVTVHSGILKTNGSEIYHAHFSDNCKHGQVFVNDVLDYSKHLRLPLFLLRRLSFMVTVYFG